MKNLINSKKIRILFLLVSLIVIMLIILLCLNGTLSFFAARAENTGDSISGKSLDVSLELTAELLSDNATASLIPLDNDIESLNNAIQGYGNNTNDFDNTKSCLDKNGYSVCKVYEIKVTNKGTGSTKINGGVLSLYGNKTPNITCAVMKNKMTVNSNDTCVGAKTLASDDIIGDGETLKYYLIVYINNLDGPQTDAGLFEGTIEFTTQVGISMKEEIS